MPEEVLTALGDAISTSFPDAAGLVAVADATGVQLVETCHRPPRADIAARQRAPRARAGDRAPAGDIASVTSVTDRHRRDD
jgi:hypothetical protein